MPEIKTSSTAKLCRRCDAKKFSVPIQFVKKLPMALKTHQNSVLIQPYLFFQTDPGMCKEKALLYTNLLQNIFGKKHIKKAHELINFWKR